MEDRFPFPIIALSGPMGSGKTFLAQTLAHTLDAEVVSFGSFVASEVRRQGLCPDRKTLQETGQSLLQSLGADAFLRRVLLSAKPVPDGHVLVIDGVRHVDIWQAIQRTSQHCLLIYLLVNEEERVQRLLMRDHLDGSELQEVLCHPMETCTSLLQQHANLILQHTSLERALEQIQGLLQMRICYV